MELTLHCIFGGYIEFKREFFEKSNERIYLVDDINY